ncbi:MAG TPA: cyclopropane fatty acyl phospholipid synthase [Candidatus Eisenbacteria bacterium]|nr:cyclopropane fatty acyl phospholipid synthase [Candidatus Eisenbacteria bacterium]
MPRIRQRDAAKEKGIVKDLLARADIAVDGSRPWDLRVRDDRFYGRALADRNLGLGEAYMDDWVRCDRWDEFMCRLLRSDLRQRLPLSLSEVAFVARSAVMNFGAKKLAFFVGEAHYDIGDDLYERMLDRSMTYTCAYWKDAADLDQAQEAKLDLVCRKIGLKRGMTVLDIGCGWGSFAKFAASRYGASVVGITVSKAQLAAANRACMGLPAAFRLQDYRDVTGKYDRIVSLGMFEHVHYKNYRRYMEVAHRALKADGQFLLHTIGGNISETSMDPWIHKYIFPNSMLPSIAQIGRSIEGLFVMEDWHNFGPDYDRTLMAWYANFSRRWPELSAKYGERFRRMWEYYLLSCAGSFRARANQLWQIVLTKKGIEGGYETVR